MYPGSALIIGLLAFFYTWTIFFPYVQNQFGLESTAGIALGSSLAGLGAMVVIPPIIGTILDRTNSSVIPSFVAATLIALGGISFALMTASESWAMGKWYWYASSFLLGGGATALATGLLPPLVSQWFADDEQGSAQGLMMGSRYLALAAASPILGGLLNLLGFSFGFAMAITLFAVAITIILGGFFWRFPTAEEQREIFDQETTEESEGGNGEAMSFGMAIKDARFWILLVAMTAASFSFTGFQQNFSLILVQGLVENAGYSEGFITGTVVPTFLSINYVFMAAGAIFWGRIMDYLGGPFRTLILVYGIPATLYAVFFLSYTMLIPVLIVGALIFFGLGGEPPVHYAAVPTLFGRENVGKLLTYMNAVSVGMGMFFGPIVFAFINDVTGVYLASFGVAIVIRFVGAGAAAVGTRVASQ
ncbi:MFS transporter [Halodesulfurarchaeum sp. HSR-GB]|uniref:MFS transporter n=1 Tax=Halodesulfurarchaeum sp. HSR-GB TaxID=3074077 RepID=UPI00285AC735|nr:MFS transporter [Halodesulfurarchaeum sp. HSR-GB]MDR5656519.1 MFS transporter [Halodesulfurarchaeum sp. HSR-GB]